MSFGVATLRAVVHAGDKTSRDARCVVSKVVLLSVCHAALVVLHDVLRALVLEYPLWVRSLRLLPSDTRTNSSHSSASSDSTTPLSPDHPLTHVSPTPTPTRASFHRRTMRITVCVQPTMSPGHSARVTEAMALSDSAFRKRYRSSYETPSPSPSPTLQVRKSYKGTSELILDTDSKGDELGDEDIEEDESLDADDERERSDDEGHGLDDEGHGSDDEAHGLGDKDHRLDDEGLGLEEEEAAPEGQQAARLRALELIEEIAPSTYEIDPEDDRVYTDILIYPPVAPVQTPLSPEWSSDSLPISPSSPVVPSPIASPVATPTATILVDKDQFLEVEAQLELHESILQDHTQRLDALPPTLITDIDRDLRELYTRSGVVRGEIFSQRYMFRSLQHEQERTTVTFGALWRPVLALEAWAGHVDTRLADMSRDRYNDHRLIHDMLVQ
ncbi:hypothetical protein Tco_0757989 [Tanacetum coccineum]